MKFLKKHKWLSFAVISFFMLSGVNFYMIVQLVSIIRKDVKKGLGLFFRKNKTSPFFKKISFSIKINCVILSASKNVRHCVKISRRHNYADERNSKRGSRKQEAARL